MDISSLQTRKYSIEEIAPLLDLCVSEDTLGAIIAETEDLRVLEFALWIRIYRAAQAETKTQVFNKPLRKLLGMITPNNHDKICNVLTVVLFAEPSNINFRCLLEHLRDKSEDVQVTMSLLAVALSTCALDLFHELIDEAFLVELYLKTGSGRLRELLVKYAELKGSYPKLLTAVLRNEDLQTLVCLSDALAPTKQPEFWGFLQSKLLSDVHSDRKLALYILKGCIKSIASENQLEGYLDVVHNRVTNSSDFVKMWGDFFNLIETLDDNQLHLIIPSLTLLEGIVGIHPRWLACVYKSILTHSLNSVAFHGLTRLLHDGRNMGVSFFKMMVKYVLVALNKTDDSGGYHKSLRALEHFVGQCNNEVYVVLVEESLSAPWVPPAAWYFYKTVLNYGVQTIPMSVLAEVIRKLKNLPHKFIREGCLSLAANFVDFNEDVSFEESLKSAACIVECVGDAFPNFLSTRTWKKKDIVYNELEKWQREKVFISTSKIHVLMKLIKGDNEMSSKLFALAKDGGVPSQARDCIVLHLSKSYLSKTDIMDYIRQRMYDVKADDDFDLLSDIIINNVTPNEPDVKLREKSAHIISNSKHFERHQVHLAVTIACCLGHCLDVTQILGVILKETKAKLCDFFVLKYCALAPSEDDAFQAFEGLLNTPQGGGVVFKRLPDIIGCFKMEDATKFLGFCYSKLASLKNAGASVFKAGLKQYLTCRFHLGEVNCLLREYEPSAYIVADILEGKSKEGGDLEPFIPILVELLLHGGVYGKQRKIEYDVCLEIQQGRSREYSSENPAFEETKVRSKAIAALLSILGSTRNDCKMADTIVSVLLEKYRVHFNKRYFADSQIHLLKLRIIQGLLLVHTYISSEQVAVLIEFIMNSFCSESHQPSIKHLLQWLLIQLTTHSSNFIDEIAKKIRCTDHARPSTIVAFIPVLLHTCRGKPEATIEKLFSVLLPWTMGPQFKLRLYSQIAIKKLGDFCYAKPYESVLHKYKAAINGIQLTLTESNEKEIRNTLQNDEYFLNLFEPEEHYTLETIYIEIPRLDGVTPTEWELLRLQDLPESDILKACNKDEKLRRWVFLKRVVNSEQANDVKEGAYTTNLQKKIIPCWVHETRKESQGDLILVCSLIESPANLGGLSRTCEVYGVKQMVINDGKTVHGKDFKSLSMSSENWVDFIEVKVEELRDYLMRAKQQGYVVIGAEQTSESVRLDGFRFPLKSILVLGNEREGVLPSIIPLLDVCLEIPQFGFIRSLNVHVAGAIFIWEYVKQHLIK